MHNSFENELAKQLNQFQLKPSEQVWQEIEIELDKKPSRKFPAFWWISICASIIAGGFWIFNMQQPLLKSAPTPLTKTQPQFHIEQTQPKPPSQSIKHQNTSLDFQQTDLSLLNNQQPKHLTQIKKPTDTNSASLKTNQQPNSPLIISVTELQLMNNVVNDTNTKTDTTTDIKTDITTNTKTESGNTTPVNASPIQLQQQQKGHWILLVGGGTTHQNNNGITQSFMSADRLSFASGANSGAIGTGSTIPADLSSASNGFHALIGMGFEKPMGKRWLVGMGVQYAYHQNSQPIGKQIDSIQTISSALSGNNSLVQTDHYYTGGNKETLTNQAHWLSIPFSLYYKINKSRKNNFQLLLGCSPTWIITQKWLIKDEAAKQLYYAPSLNNSFNVSIDLGLRYSIQNKWGLTAKYSEGITSTTKLTNNKTYWNTFSIQINKTLSFFTK